MPGPIATWNPARGAWETPELNILCEHSVPYLETFPTSGTWDATGLYPLPAQEHPTNVNASSFLPTPTAQLNEPAPWKPDVKWWLQSRATRNLEGVVTGNTPLLPTPNAADSWVDGANISDEARARQYMRNGRPHTTTGSLAKDVHDKLLPTPTSSDDRGPVRHPGQPPGTWDRGTDLPEAIGKLLPTPAANDSGNTPEEHLSKKPGRTQVTSLAIITENGLIETGGLLPTPTMGDGTGGHSSRSGPRRSERLLGGLAKDLLPTPAARDWRDGGPAFTPVPEKSKLGHTVKAMLPTPNSRDWKGSPSDAWEGQASLPREATRIGVPTSRQSGDGKPGLDDELPGQLSLDLLGECD